MKIRLSDVQIYWYGNSMRKNGVAQTKKKVVEILKRKHAKLYSHLPEYIPLTTAQADAVIFNDPLREAALVISTAKGRKNTIREQRKLHETEIKKIQEEKKLLVLKEKREAKTATSLVKRLSTTKTPEDFGIAMLTRVPIQYVVAAIMSDYPELSEMQCKLIIGTWVKTGKHA